jgi:ankyrin repeat protein
LAYLLAWSPNLDIQDTEGYSALHLAVKSVDELNSCRMIRALLIKGADASIKDKSDKVPFDYVDDIVAEYL